ncbi:hypothetical protein Mgra_00000202 [Meloidogyne graminicola]|uniref:Uncharacterized protein n=1 Tax=Meloidogyne graminicola TaxID=189291 RepID=A0A8T0A2R5_9BILA|nr:hypothetical protein Mgra_00000202 [Meloidogyne graminicola]
MFINNKNSFYSSLNSFKNYFNSLLIVLLIFILFSSSEIVANDDNLQILGNAQFFRRNAKWINLPSGGGSLVSGRGNFRPGFHSNLNKQQILNDEPFFLLKRSSSQIPIRKTPFAISQNLYKKINKYFKILII